MGRGRVRGQRMRRPVPISILVRGLPGGLLELTARRGNGLSQEDTPSRLAAILAEFTIVLYRPH
jgi:hypothetical protein